MLELDLLPNLSITAGAVHTTVRYSTDGQSYNPPVYWEGGVAPAEMSGECLLIDIPINLRYNFLNSERSRFFLSAGISSYIMINEEYQFRFSDESVPGIRKWSNRTGTRHLLSNANFSIGYEFDLNRT